MEIHELKEQVLARLQELGIEYDTMEIAGEGAVTIEDCEAVSRHFKAPVLKTLLVSNRQGTRFHLVVMPAHKPFVTREFSQSRGVSRVSFVKPEVMAELISTPVGGCSPLSAIADTDCKVEVCMDFSLEGLEQVAVPAGTPNAYVTLSLADVRERYLPSTGHEMVLV